MRCLLVSASVTLSLALAGTAAAADQLWWANPGTGSPAISRSNPDGSGATVVVLQAAGQRAATTVADPAHGKLYWLTVGDDATDPNALYSANLDGTGITRIANSVPFSPVTDYSNWSLTIDPEAQKLYWAVWSGPNTGNQGRWWIRWSKTDGSQAGMLYDSQATPQMETAAGGTFPLVVDPTHGRIWWGNFSGDDFPPHDDDPAFGYANLDGSGGAATIDLSCTSMSGPLTIDPNDASSMVIDYAAGYIYAQLEFAYDANGWFVGRSGLDGSNCQQVGQPIGSGGSSSRGAALDPDTGWLYQFRNSLTRSNYLNVGSSLPISAPWPNLPISPSSAATTPRSPFIIKPPKLTPASVALAASGTEVGATLTCACQPLDDQITMRVYRGAATQAIKWYRDGVEIPGETGKTLTTAEPGVYKAVFTAGNFAGDTEATSNEVTISAKPTPDPGPTPGPTPSNSFSMVSAATPTGAIVSAGRLPGAGKLRQVAARRVGGRWVPVCSSRKTATMVGRFRLSCEPNSATRRAQKSGRVRIRVRVTFTPDGGTPRTLTRYIWLRSLKPQYTG